MENRNKRNFYVAASYMGVEFSYDSPCWKVYRFKSAKARDAWLSAHEYKDGKLVAESVSRKTAMKIIGYKTSSLAESVIFEFDSSDPYLMFRFE